MGLPGLETLLPIVYTHGVLEGRMTRSEFVAKCCTNPAKLMGLFPQKGASSAGSDADIAIIDPTKKIEVDCTQDGDERRLEPVPGLVARRASPKRPIAAAGRSSTGTNSWVRAAGAAGCRGERAGSLDESGFSVSGALIEDRGYSPCRASRGESPCFGLVTGNHLNS